MDRASIPGGQNHLQCFHGDIVIAKGSANDSMYFLEFLYFWSRKLKIITAL